MVVVVVETTRLGRFEWERATNVVGRLDRPD